MTPFNRWNHEPHVTLDGDEFLASSPVFPGVFGEGETREEAIENFWQGVDLVGDLARHPDWPHDPAPYAGAWEPSDDGDDELPEAWRADEGWRADDAADWRADG